MYRLGACQHRGAHDLFFLQIAFRSLRASDTKALVGERHMERVFILLGIHRDCRHAHFLTRPYDTDSYLAPVGDQYF